VLEPGARGLRLDRSYSKNLLTALEQKRRDRVDIRKGLGARNKRGEVDGIAFRGSDRARARAMRQAVHEFADTQQNTGRTERETARRSAQTATGRRGESGRQRAQRVLEEGMAELRRRGVDTSGMSGVERAKAAAAMGVKLEQDRGVRARAGRRATAVKSSAKVRAERAVPTKVALPRVPFSAKGGAAYRVRPERELLGAAAKQLIGDVRSSLPQVAEKLRSEIDRLEQAYEGSHREMDLPGRRANRNRVGAMKALLHDIESGKRGVEGRVARLMGRGEEYRRVAAGISRAMVQAKLLTPEQAKNAALMDYAVSRFADQGVRHNPERMPTDADAAAYAARKGEAASAGAAARQAGREASQARVESARAGARGTRVAAQRRARALKPGEKGPERPVLSKSEAKAARKAATEETMRRRAASAELHAIETTGKAAVESAIKEHRAKGLEGEELRAAVEKDPMVVNARTTVQAARKRLGKVAAKTKTERRADALWVRQRVTARKAQEARAAAAQARRDVGGRPKEFVRGLELEDGTKLTQDQIEQRFRQEYGKDAALPAFISAQPGAHGAGAYFVNWLSRSGNRKSADTHRKTGRMEQLGAADVTEAGAIDALVHSQGVLSAAQNWDRFIHAFAVTAPKGARGPLMTWDEAEGLGRAMSQGENAAVTGHGPYVPVRVAPSSYDQARIEEVLRGQSPGEAEAPKGVIASRVAEALRRDPPDAQARKQARNVVLVPEAVLNEFSKAQSVSTSEIAGLGRAYTNVFRSTVLPLSTKWLTGNVAEAILRLGVAGATPVDVLLGRRFIRDMLEHDAEAGKAFQARTTGGLLYGTADRLSARTGGLMDGTALEGPQQAFQAIRHAPVVKQVIDGYMAFAHAVFTFNKMIEQSFQAAVVGKEVRRRVAEDTQSWSKSWQVAVGLGHDAYQDALLGAVGTPAQVRFARAIDRTLGKYSRFSPAMRRTTQTVAPFLPWYANALRFVFWTLPVEHPALTALMVSVEREFAADAKAQADALPPGDLGANPQGKDGGIFPVTRYTPFGAFTGAGREGQNVADEILSPVFPQIQGAWNALRGMDAFGRKASISDGSAPARLQLALYSMLEGYLPAAQIARRLRERGDTGYSDSTFWSPKGKPGTSHGRSAAGRIFNPFEETYLQPKAGEVVVSPGPTAKAAAA
jgi:hypothetical protein